MHIDCLQKWTSRGLKKQLALILKKKKEKKRDIIRESKNNYLTDRFRSVKVLPCGGSLVKVCLMRKQGLQMCTIRRVSDLQLVIGEQAA